MVEWTKRRDWRTEPYRERHSAPNERKQHTAQSGWKRTLKLLWDWMWNGGWMMRWKTGCWLKNRRGTTMTRLDSVRKPNSEMRFQRGRAAACDPLAILTRTGWTGRGAAPNDVDFRRKPSSVSRLNLGSRIGLMKRGRDFVVVAGDPPNDPPWV